MALCVEDLSAVSVTERKNGSLAGLLNSLRDVEFTVGIHADEGGAQHSDGQTVAEIAESHEFGLGVPTRSWLRGWVDGNQTQIEDDIRDFAVAGVKRGTPSEVVAQQLALRFAGRVQKRITNTPGDWPPNSPVTIAKKGSSKPLIDTGVMRSSITGKVK